MKKVIERILVKLIKDPIKYNTTCYIDFVANIKFEYANYLYHISIVDTTITIKIYYRNHLVCPNIEIYNVDADEFDGLYNSLCESIKKYYINQLAEISYNL